MLNAADAIKTTWKKVLQVSTIFGEVWEFGNLAKSRLKKLMEKLFSSERQFILYNST